MAGTRPTLLPSEPDPLSRHKELSVGSTASARTTRSHEGIRRKIEACVSLAEDARAFEARAPSISEWSVANHLEHLLRGDRWMIGWVESAVCGETGAGADACEAGRPTAVGFVVLSTGFIPRGRGRAPDASHPVGLSAPEIVAGFREVQAMVDRLQPRLVEVDAMTLTLQHPMLGCFTPARWLRFADIHHDHHDKIIRDILASA